MINKVSLLLSHLLSYIFTHIYFLTFTSVADSIFTNPFILPGDDQIFRIREEEKRKKQEAHNQSKTASVWEKNKVTAKSRTARLKDLLGDNVKIGNVLEAVKAPSEEMKAVAPVRRGEKENMTEYIAKKREMFLVQMSLDTKREEIRKLEEKAQLKEEALQRSEQMLEEVHTFLTHDLITHLLTPS